MVGHDLLALSPADGGYTHYLLRKKAADQALDRDLQQAREHVWQTRVRSSGGMQAKATMRNHTVAVGQPASFDVQDEAPSAVELLLAAVGGALTTGLGWRLSQQQIDVHNLEVVVKGRLSSSLFFLGVEHEGSPALERIDVTIYADADCEPAVLEAVLAETVRRCPVTQSLLCTVPIETRLQTL
jgi:uncharacterized OsmC-like protein